MRTRNGENESSQSIIGRKGRRDGVTILLLILLMGSLAWIAVDRSNSTQRAHVAEENQQTFAESIQEACNATDSGVTDLTICKKADRAAAAPVTPAQEESAGNIIIGPRGADGEDGAPGAIGPKGIGIKGEQGIAGLLGPKGDLGGLGPTGLTGTGLKGDTGDTGVGKTGATGETGATGPAGAPGAKGDTGEAGTPGGPAGTDGDDGAAGRGVVSFDCVDTDTGSNWVITFDKAPLTQTVPGPCHIGRGNPNPAPVPVAP